MEIGQRLEYFRSKAEHTQQSLAAETSVSRETIVAIENGRSSPTVATLAVLLRGCGVTLGEFFREDYQGEISNAHAELHIKLQEILESDEDAAKGITVNIDYLHGHMLTKLQRSASDKRKENRPNKKRKTAHGPERKAS